MASEEETPEITSLALHLDREIKEEPVEEEDSEEPVILNLGIVPRKIVKPEPVDDDSEDAGIQNSAEEAEDSGDSEGTSRKRMRLDTDHPDNLPPPTLRNCPLCQIPKEQHELRLVKDQQESVSILIGWYLAEKSAANKSIINEWICERHFTEAVVEVYKSLRISCFADVYMIKRKGDQIMEVCQRLDPTLSMPNVKSILYKFCREIHPKMYIQNPLWRMPAVEQSQPIVGPEPGPSTSAQSSVESISPKPKGSQKRKSGENRPKQPTDVRCIVCSLPRPPAEFHEINKTHEALAMMIRCVIAADLSMDTAMNMMDSPDKMYTCVHHIQGSVKELYRSLKIRSLEELVMYVFQPDQTIWRLAKFLKPGITPNMLRDQLVRFCHVNERTEANPSDEIPYESVDITTIGPPTGRPTVWEDSNPEIQPETLNGPSTSTMNASGGVVDVDDDGDSDIIVLGDSAPAQSSGSTVTVKDYIQSTESIVCCTCGQEKKRSELSPLYSQTDKLAVLLIWIIDGGLSIANAQHFLSIKDKKQMMCTQHAQFTVGKIYEHLGVSDMSGLSTCRLYSNHRLQVTAHAVLPFFWLTILGLPNNQEGALRFILSSFCRKYEERAAQESVQAIRATPTTEEINANRPPIASQQPGVKCIICQQPKSYEELHPLENADEKLIILIKRILIDSLSIQQAMTLLYTRSTQYVCLQHFPDTTTQIFTSLKICRINQILGLGNEVIFEWLRIARILKPTLQAVVFKTYLQEFCRSTAAMGTAEREENSVISSPPKTQPPSPAPIRPHKFTCSLCFETRLNSSLRLTKQASEKQLLAIGWILMGKMTAVDGSRFWKREPPVMVCYADFEMVIDRIFVELRINQRAELPTAYETFKGRVMGVVNSLAPDLSLEVFRSFLVTWTTANPWSLELWEKGHHEDQVLCSLCSKRVSKNDVLRVKLRRDTLVLMMAWIHCKGYTFDQSRKFIFAQNYVCHVHMKETAQFILEFLGISSIDQMTSELNQPLAKLLWYAQESGQSVKILKGDVIRMIREFFKENKEVIEGKTPPLLSIRSPQPSTSASPLIQFVTVVPKVTDAAPNRCVLCQRRKSSHLLQFVNKENVKLLLATGWMLTNKCNAATAKVIAAQTSFYACQFHFQDVMIKTIEVLGIKSELELRCCTMAQKQQLMASVNLVNPNAVMTTFWDFLLQWICDHSGIETPLRQCSICAQTRNFSKLEEVASKQEKVVLVLALVLEKRYPIDKGTGYVHMEKTSTVCKSHLERAVSVILEHLGVEQVDDISGASKTKFDEICEILDRFNVGVRPSMAEFQTLLKKFHDDHCLSLEESSMSSSSPAQRPLFPRAIRDGVFCSACQNRRPKSEIKFIRADGEKLVILTGCVLSGLRSVAEAKLSLSRELLSICSQHCPDAIEAIQKGLKTTSDPSWMSDVMSVVGRLRPGFSSDQFSKLFRDVMLRSMGFKNV